MNLDRPAPERLTRAAKLFRFEERPSDSPLVETVWRTRSEPADAFISVAVSRWEIVVTRQEGRTSLTVRGPETKATTATIPQDAEFFGVQFKLGMFMPHDHAGSGCPRPLLRVVWCPASATLARSANLTSQRE